MSYPAISLPDGFSIHECTETDLSEMMEILRLAFEKDEVNLMVMKDITDHSQVESIMLKEYAPRWTLPDIKSWKVVEKDTGKMVAWAAIQHPWNITPAMTPELISYLDAPSDPKAVSPVPGINLEAWGEMVDLSQCTSKYGYDPNTDFQRKNTAVLPSYQKRKIGSFLTQTVNAYTDRFARGNPKTFVQMRPSSVKIFTRFGFVDVGFWDSRVERWGGDHEAGITRIAVRVAKGAEV